MKLANPQIGFDRFIHLDWLTAALNYRAGFASLEELDELLNAAGLGVAARKKTRTVLNRLWLEPRTELKEFANRGIEIYKVNPKISCSALTWGMAIATYPFFGKVSEIVGRLTILQGDCSSSEVHRRMSEIYGEREGTYRMTNMVLQSQANWGAIERVDKGKRLIRLAPINIFNDYLIAWLAEAAIRYTGNSLSVSNMQSTSVLYPFEFGQLLPLSVSKSLNLEIMTEGSNDQLVAIKNCI